MAEIFCSSLGCYSRHACGRMENGPGMQSSLYFLKEIQLVVSEWSRHASEMGHGIFKYQSVTMQCDSPEGCTTCGQSSRKHAHNGGLILSVLRKHFISRL